MTASRPAASLPHTGIATFRSHLVDLFLPLGSGRPAWVSTDLRSPAFLTVATYPALHAARSGEPEEQTQPIEADENGDAKSHVFESLSNGTDVNHGAQGHILLPEAFTEAKSRALVFDEAHSSPRRVVENVP
jgi:hypothetical protein